MVSAMTHPSSAPRMLMRILCVRMLVASKYLLEGKKEGEKEGRKGGREGGRKGGREGKGRGNEFRKLLELISITSIILLYLATFQ